MGRYADGSYYADSNLSEDINAAGLIGGSNAPTMQGQAKRQQEDEEEQNYRKYKLGQMYLDAADMRQHRNMQQGYYDSPQQMAGDAYGPMYSYQPSHTGESIQMSGGAPPGQSQSQASYPLMRRQVAPGASASMSLMAQAGRTGTGSNSISMDDFAKREQIKADSRIRAESEINKMKQESKATGQQFDAAKAKATILSRNPGGIDPAVLDEILDPYSGGGGAKNPLSGFPVIGGLVDTANQAVQKPIRDPHENTQVSVAPIKEVQAVSQTVQPTNAPPGKVVKKFPSGSSIEQGVDGSYYVISSKGVRKQISDQEAQKYLGDG